MISKALRRNGGSIRAEARVPSVLPVIHHNALWYEPRQIAPVYQSVIPFDAELAWFIGHAKSVLAAGSRAKLERCRKFPVETKRCRISIWRIQQERCGAFRIWHRMGRWCCCSIAAGGDHFATASWRIIAIVTLRFVQQAQA